MRVGVVDIGTNSMRLLVTDGVADIGRWEEVTGLGRGVDRTGALSADAIERTVAALGGFGLIMDDAGVERRAAMATSASRDASNREEFFDRVEDALGVRPRLITGSEEARYGFTGATGPWDGPRPWVVCDIGGGSTEIVTEVAEVSVDIGSVRLTERWLTTDPASEETLHQARRDAMETFARIDRVEVGSLLGVGGTWMEMGGLIGGPERDIDRASVTLSEVSELVEKLATMTVDEIASMPTLNPKRAGTILGGAVVAEAVMARLGAVTATWSLADTLDGLTAELLGLT